MATRSVTSVKPLGGLEALRNYEKETASAYSAATFSLDRVQRLLEALHHPEKSLKTIHVAGTKGKGSTSYFIALMLARHGHRVGLYTSPHLLLINERIRFLVKDKETLIGSDALNRLVRMVIKEAERLRKRHPRLTPTYFEVLTVAALAAFAEAGVEYAVLETGLGGRWDATNVVDPLVSVITPISIDHVQWLGHTLSAIAMEKAGIMKPGRPCVFMSREPSVVNALERTARRQGVFLVDAARRSRFDRVELSPRESHFKFSTDRRDYGELYLSMPGEFQLENASAAIQALEVLEGYEFELKVDKVRSALAHARWMGRLQVLGERPWVIADGAHNEASALALRASLSRIYPYRRLFLIFAAAKDKEIEAMGRVLCPLASELLVTAFNSPRAAAPNEILARWKPYLQRSHVFIAPTITDAMQDALSRADREDLICVTGSLYGVAELFRYRQQWAGTLRRVEEDHE